MGYVINYRYSSIMALNRVKLSITVFLDKKKNPSSSSNYSYLVFMDIQLKLSLCLVVFKKIERTTFLLYLIFS